MDTFVDIFSNIAKADSAMQLLAAYLVLSHVLFITAIAVLWSFCMTRVKHSDKFATSTNTLLRDIESNHGEDKDYFQRIDNNTTDTKADVKILLDRKKE